MLRNFFIFILCLAPWFLATLVPVDYNYYNDIILPWFAPPTIFYSIAWTIVYILIALTMTMIINSYNSIE